MKQQVVTVPGDRRALRPCGSRADTPRMSCSARDAASTPFALVPDYCRRVWGGQRLRPSADPIGEAWVIGGANRVADGAFVGRTLAEVARDGGAAVLGARTVARTGTRFPLLIKLLDTADWLSVQVHPNDAQAERLEGAGRCGKAEAWHIVAAAPDAQVIIGPRAGTTPQELARAIHDGTLPESAARASVTAGDTLTIAPGTIHALGPGLLVYEVQQPSDITYRVFDWNRPQAAGRPLHLDQSVAVARADLRATPLPPPSLPDGGRARLLASPWFTLDLLCSTERPLALDTEGATFHALTVLDGTAELRGAGWTRRLSPLESLLAPAACGAYMVQGVDGPCRLLLATP